MATTPAPGAGPLTPQHLQELSQAQQRAAKIRRAAGVAAFNGWVTAFFAAASAPFAPFSVLGLLTTAGLTCIAYNEFRGRKRLLQFDAQAVALLGWNQLAYLALIVAYSLAMLSSGLAGEGPFSKELKQSPELAEVLGSVEQYDELFRLVLVAVYGSVIVLSAIFQGGNAWYYFSRRRLLEGYLRETPGWICHVQRATANG